VFPNSHVHRVKLMLNAPANTVNDESQLLSQRRIVAFFFVNPLTQIVLIREVAPQQPAAGGVCS